MSTPAIIRKKSTLNTSAKFDDGESEVSICGLTEEFGMG